MLNFQNASLNDVLTYLSEAAGFVIVQEAPVTGTVNIVSRQPLNAEEAVDLLNTVLIDKGLRRHSQRPHLENRQPARCAEAAIFPSDVGEQSGIDSAEGQRRDPNPAAALRRGGEARGEPAPAARRTQATISANEGSNAIILTDTQTNIHRMAQIIHALDTSVSALSTITVMPLKYADSKEVAAIITQLFAPAQTGPQGGQAGRRRGTPRRRFSRVRLSRRGARGGSERCARGGGAGRRGGR